MHKWTLFVWYFIYNFFISARFHHWQIKHFQFFEARLLCLRFRRFGTFAIFPGAFINHVIYMLDKQSNMTSFIFFAIPYRYENSCNQKLKFYYSFLFIWMTGFWCCRNLDLFMNFRCTFNLLWNVKFVFSFHQHQKKKKKICFQFFFAEHKFWI